jgi:general secretion pathway protein G
VEDLGPRDRDGGRVALRSERRCRMVGESLGSALDLFYLDEGRYPSGSEGLAVLVERPDGVELP